MKTALNLIIGITAVAGVGYLVWSQTPLGKNVLSKWLIKKWEEQAKKVNMKLNPKQFARELDRLNYQDLELLTRYTLIDPLGKSEKGELDDKTFDRATRLYKKMVETGVFKRAKLDQLENVALPG